METLRSSQNWGQGREGQQVRWGRLERSAGVRLGQVPGFFQVTWLKGWISAWPNSLILQTSKQRSRRVPDLLQVTQDTREGLALGLCYRHTGVWNEPVSERMNSFPGAMVLGWPVCLRGPFPHPVFISLWFSSQEASSSRKPSCSVLLCNPVASLSLLLFGIEKIPGPSPSLTM